MKHDVIILHTPNSIYSFLWLVAITPSDEAIGSGFTYFKHYETLLELMHDCREHIINNNIEVKQVICNKGGIIRDQHPEFWSKNRTISPSMHVFHDIMDDAEFTILRLLYA